MSKTDLGALPYQPTKMPPLGKQIRSLERQNKNNASFTAKLFKNKHGLSSWDLVSIVAHSRNQSQNKNKSLKIEAKENSLRSQTINWRELQHRSRLDIEKLK